MTTEAIRDLICSPVLEVGYGVELLDSTDTLIEDISDDLVDGEIRRDCRAEVHGTCRLQLMREIDWSNDRLRPYQRLTAGDTTETFYLGVFLPSRPVRPLGKTPTTFDVTGMDKLSLLMGEIGDTYEIVSGTTYADALAGVLSDAGVTGNGLHVSGDDLANELSEDLVWVLNATDPYRWIDVASDLLSAIGYTDLYCNADGYYCSEPWTDPATKAPLWEFDISDPDADIVDRERTLAIEGGLDTRGAVNWWRFVRTGLSYQPLVPLYGDGIYDVDLSDGGTQRKRVRYLYVDSQTALETEGDRIVAEDTQSERTLRLYTHPLPILEHLAVLTYTDSEIGTVKGQVSAYKIPLRPVGNRTDITLEVL